VFTLSSHCISTMPSILVCNHVIQIGPAPVYEGIPKSEVPSRNARAVSRAFASFRERDHAPVSASEITHVGASSCWIIPHTKDNARSSDFDWFEL
jgi:hypothetical protein